jgi:acetyltransferase-like isoleucine patch superfamily enzyme
MTSIRVILQVGAHVKSAFGRMIDTGVCLIRIALESKWDSTDFHSGRRLACVLGTGPSLNIDIKHISTNDRTSTTIFCVNDFYKSEHFVDIKPDNYVIVDPDYWNDGLYTEVASNLINTVADATWPLVVWIPVTARGSEFVRQVNSHGIRHLFFNKTPLSGVGFVKSHLFRHRLAMPHPQNVLVAAITIAIWTGAEEIELFGADHDWHRDITISEDNILQTRHRHTYLDKEFFQPFYKPATTSINNEKMTFTIAEIFHAWGVLHSSYEQLQLLSDERGVKIYNCGSMHLKERRKTLLRMEKIKTHLVWAKLYLIKAFKRRKVGLFSLCRNSKIHGRAKVHSFVILKDSEIGDMSYVANFSRITNCRIEKYTSIGPNVIVGLGMHPSDWVSTHPAFFSPDLKSLKSFVSESSFIETKEILIGNDVWIGQGALILDGITVGNGAIIGAGAVVTRDVPPFSMVVGVPAKVVKYRFSKEDIAFLQDLQWWNRSDDWLHKHAFAFQNVEALKNVCAQELLT